MDVLKSVSSIHGSHSMVAYLCILRSVDDRLRGRCCIIVPGSGAWRGSGAARRRSASGRRLDDDHRDPALGRLLILLVGRHGLDHEPPQARPLRAVAGRAVAGSAGVPSWTVTAGSATRLRYQAGCRSRPRWATTGLGARRRGRTPARCGAAPDRCPRVVSSRSVDAGPGLAAGLRGYRRMCSATHGTGLSKTSSVLIRPRRPGGPRGAWGVDLVEHRDGEVGVADPAGRVGCGDAVAAGASAARGRSLRPG